MELTTNYIKMKSKHLIPKAQFGTGIVRKGLRWLFNHAVPTRE